MTTEITPADREELKPCPFCGGNKARTIHIRDGRKVACPCGACGKPEFHGPLDRPDAEVRAITAWNTRIADPSWALRFKGPDYWRAKGWTFGELLARLEAIEIIRGKTR